MAEKEFGTQFRTNIKSTSEKGKTNKDSKYIQNFNKDSLVN